MKLIEKVRIFTLRFQS